MTRQAILARAVAYHSTAKRGVCNDRQYRDLDQADLEVFWSMVSELKAGVSAARLVRVRPERTPNRTITPYLRPVEANRLRHAFWIDQHGEPQVLP